MSESSFSEFSAQDSHLAALEAQEWIEKVVNKKFPKSSFRESLGDGVLLCELMNKIDPGSIRRINKSKSPIAYLDNIQQFLNKCQDLGLNDAQLFDTMDLQEIKVARKVGVKRSEADRRIRSVCITLFWLGRTVAEMEDYTGPQLDLDLFRKLMEGNLSDGEDEKKANEGMISEQPHSFHVDEQDHESDEDPRIESPVTNGTTPNGPLEGLTFEQEQTADELLADIQNAVDEMLHDFQASPVTTNPPPVAPKTKRSGAKGPQKNSPPKTGSGGRTHDHIIRMRSKNGGFGFQIMGGVDSDLSAQVDYIVPGSAADSSGLQVGDKMVHVNGQDIQNLSHVELVSVIKKAGQLGEVVMGVKRSAPSSTVSHASKSNEDHVGFSRRESREAWEADNEERERQAQEIALLYPHRVQPIENGVAGPSPSHRKGSLPPLVEHQEEAMFEQIQEMIDLAPSPPPPDPSPPTSPLPPSLPSSSSQNSSHPATPLTVSPTNQIQDDKETIERELHELTQMEADTKPVLDDDLSDSMASENEVPASNQVEEEEMSDDEQAAPVGRESENTVIKFDSFRVKESNSPLPLSPITEVSPGAEVSPDPEPHHMIDSSSPEVVRPSPEMATPSPEVVTPSPEVVMPPPPQVATPSPQVATPSPDPIQTLDRELEELMKFADNRKEEAAAAPSQNRGTISPADNIVTPPPMFDSSPPPPKPTSAAPKRMAKRPAPPPPKPKSRSQSSPLTESPTEDNTNSPAVSPPNIQIDAILPPPLEELPIEEPLEDLSESLFQPSKSPDLLTQMQELAYSKSITPKPEEPLTIKSMESSRGGGGGQMEVKGSLSSSSSHPQRQPLPRDTITQSGLGHTHSHHVAASKPLYPTTISPPAANGISSTHTSSSSIITSQTSNPKLVEVLGDVKIQHVMKQRWTPKSKSADPSPAQTPEHQPMPMGYQQPPVNYQQEKVSTVRNGITPPDKYANYGKPKQQQPLGISSVVMAKGIGAGMRRGIGLGSRDSLPRTSTNPYQQQQNLQQQTQSWKSQEELSSNQPRGVRTQSSARDSAYRQKSMSLPRGNGDIIGRGSRNNTWAANNRSAVKKDGFQVAYAIQAGSPHDLCSRCHQPLGQGTVLSVPGLKTLYHTKCFTCRVCRSLLAQGGQSTTVMMKNMQPHCRFCISADNGTQMTEC